MSSPITVEPDAVDGLATELAALARELSDEAQLCRSTATSLHTSLGGPEGWTAGAAGTGWASLARVLADRGSAVADTLRAAMAAYRAADDCRAGQLSAPAGERGPR
jgi:hypothetical protein